MSDASPTLINPFEPTVTDEEIELGALAHALLLARGFKILFARCNQPEHRRRLVSALREELAGRVVQEIHFSEPITHLLDALRERLDHPLPDAVFVSGLEYSLPVAAEAHVAPLIANLNAARNAFPQVVPCPLVLWVPEYTLTTIARGAPDFFSIRSGVYHFAATPSETTHLVESLATGEEWGVESLPLAEKQERIAAIENLLADYRALPLTQRDRRAEDRLLYRLGNLYDTLGYWSKAEAAFQQGLEICRELGDRHGEGATLNSLGVVYDNQGKWSDAEKVHQESLRIKRELGNQRGEGITLNNWGSVYQGQGKWSEAEKVYQGSLKIRRDLGDRYGEGVTLNNLGIVYRSQGKWSEAEKVYQESLRIKRDLGDRHGEGMTLNNLGNIYRSQGKWDEAKKAYQESLRINRDLGDRHGEGQTIENLALLKAAQGDAAGALELEQKALQVLETTEDEAAKVKARELVEAWKKQVSSTKQVSGG